MFPVVDFVEVFKVFTLIFISLLFWSSWKTLGNSIKVILKIFQVVLKYSWSGHKEDPNKSFCALEVAKN